MILNKFRNNILFNDFVIKNVIRLNAYMFARRMSRERERERAVQIFFMNFKFYEGYEDSVLYDMTLYFQQL